MLMGKKWETKNYIIIDLIHKLETEKNKLKNWNYSMGMS